MKLKKKSLPLPTQNANVLKNINIKISVDIVQSANERLIRDGNKAYSSAHIVDGSFNVSVKYRGDIISQSISSEKIKSDYGKSLKAVSDASKL